MSKQQFPPGWDEERAKQLIAHYESLTEEEQVAEDEAAMQGMDAEAEKIIEEICEAFRDVPRGSLSLHQAITKTWTDDERVAAAGAPDIDLHWEEIPAAYIEHGGKALYGADPGSWRYFIPAFMVWSLRYFKVNDAFVSDQTIYSFDPCREKPEFHTHNMQRYGTLSSSQKRAVSHFLKYMAQNDQYADSTFARKALDEYWGQFDSSSEDVTKRK